MPLLLCIYFVAIFDDLSPSSVLGSTSGNAFPPTIFVLHRVESIFPRQFQSSQVFADGLRPIFPRCLPLPLLPPEVQFITCLALLIINLNNRMLVYVVGLQESGAW